VVRAPALLNGGIEERVGFGGGSREAANVEIGPIRRSGSTFYVLWPHNVELRRDPTVGFDVLRRMAA
jgi:hypothetical protein